MIKKNKSIKYGLLLFISVLLTILLSLLFIPKRDPKHININYNNNMKQLQNSDLLETLNYNYFTFDLVNAQDYILMKRNKVSGNFSEYLDILDGEFKLEYKNGGFSFKEILMMFDNILRIQRSGSGYGVFPYLKNVPDFISWNIWNDNPTNRGEITLSQFIINFNVNTSLLLINGNEYREVISLQYRINMYETYFLSGFIIEHIDQGGNPVVSSLEVVENDIYKILLYNDTYEAGVNNGYKHGYEKGKSDYGYKQTNGNYLNAIQYGNIRYEEGIKVGSQTGFFGLLSTAFAGVGSILSIELLPNISIGALILIPIVFGLILFVLGKKGE